MFKLFLSYVLADAVVLENRALRPGNGLSQAHNVPRPGHPTTNESYWKVIKKATRKLLKSYYKTFKSNLKIP